MSTSDGHEKIIARMVSELSGYNLVLPNGPGKSLPRFVIMEAGGRQRPATIDGITDCAPEVVVRVETQAGVYSTQIKTMVNALVGAFPLGLPFSGMRVHRAPDVRPPLPVADGVYSVPVVVTAEFNF